MKTLLHDLRNNLFILEHGPHSEANTISLPAVVQALRAITHSLTLVVQAIEILAQREDPE